MVPWIAPAAQCRTYPREARSLGFPAPDLSDCRTPRPQPYCGMVQTECRGNNSRNLAPQCKAVGGGQISRNFSCRLPRPEHRSVFTRIFADQATCARPDTALRIPVAGPLALTLPR